jgi:hypothetical protein
MKPVASGVMSGGRAAAELGASRIASLLKKLDPIQFVIVLTIVLIRRHPPISIIASKLGFTLVYLSSCKLQLK